MSDLIDLELTANLIRKDTVMMLAHAGSGHSAGSLGMADIFSCLYFDILKHKVDDPEWDGRDRVVLSNGHICPVWYATLARAGYFDLDELRTLREIDSRLQGHPVKKLSIDGKRLHSVKDVADFDVSNHNLPGIEHVSGPLGQGVSIAVGMALGLKMDGQKNEVVCVMGDGEQQEGQVWEAFMLANKERLDRLTFVLDRNMIQIDGNTYDVMPLDPLKEKYESFGMYVIEIDGHNLEEILSAFEKSKSLSGHPTVIVAHTIPGKGIDFMEDDYQWHGKAPSIGETIEALRELSVKL